MIYFNQAHTWFLRITSVQMYECMLIASEKVLSLKYLSIEQLYALLCFP